MESYYISMFLISFFFSPTSFLLLLPGASKVLFAVKAAEGRLSHGFAEKCV